MIEADLLELYESTAKVALVSGHRRDGKRLFGPDQDVQVHVETQTRKVLNQAGDEVTASGRVLCADVIPGITDEARLLLPNGQQPMVVAVETTYGLNLDTGENGPYQTVIYYGG